MQDYIVQVISAGLGAFGYSILFNIRRDKLIIALIGGSMTWLVYLIVSNFMDNLFLSNMIAAVFATLYAELFARFKKAPTTCFLIPAVIPLIPGGGLYYTMNAVISNNTELFEHYFVNTVEIAFGISIGIMFMSLIGVKLLKISMHQSRRS